MDGEVQCAVRLPTHYTHGGRCAYMCVRLPTHEARAAKELHTVSTLLPMFLITKCRARRSVRPPYLLPCLLPCLLTYLLACLLTY